MHWKWFLPFPLAAFLCGEAVQAPRLRAVIPERVAGCAAYARARAEYLRAYAHAAEKPAEARRLLAASEAALAACADGEAVTLSERVRELKRSLAP